MHCLSVFKAVGMKKTSGSKTSTEYNAWIQIKEYTYKIDLVLHYGKWKTHRPNLLSNIYQNNNDIMGKWIIHNE